ncbi:TetR/AcrR family transcriptional regulator [Kineosporia sp. NBRC 101731]|uniref:TetR/AcrR family transcriptional regulator n=1 Tax=Kineosporia sp. NBRC 101731 TaxID=3032199 RepID=UPI0024A0A498|nr:TetR/AcrR family transcriptional regulator [Kineosporia sp. NBRC 101731]GLY26833.1 putative TetR-family transcriptional regulator [Kineosporia sp. NBRC 101731]
MTSGTRPYHHGDLRRTLIEAAADVIAESGTDALSLRELARRAGVSHAAPGHHFGDRTGLLTAVAAQGFELLADSLEQADDFSGMGLRYVRFALAHPGHFAVMFRTDTVNAEDEAFQEASGRAYDVLRGGAAEALSPADDRVPALAAWSLVHGLATLLLSGVMSLDPGQSEDDLARLVTQWLTGRSV